MTYGLIFALISSFCYGLGSIIGRLTSTLGLEPLVLLQIRFTLAIPLMAAVLLIKDRRLLRATPKLLLKALFLGGVLYGIQSTTYFFALQRIDASMAVLIQSPYPILVSLMAVIFLKQRLSTATKAAALIVVVGCGLVFVDAFGKQVDLTGLLLVTISTLTYSVYYIFCQVLLDREHPLTVSFYVFVFAAVTCNLLSGPGRWASMTGQEVFWGLVLAVLVTVVAVTFMFLAIERIGSAHVSIFSTLEPVTAVTIAGVFLGEGIDAWRIGGMVLIVFGIALPNLGALRTRRLSAVAGGR